MLDRQVSMYRLINDIIDNANLSTTDSFTDIGCVVKTTEDFYSVLPFVIKDSKPVFNNLDFMLCCTELFVPDQFEIKSPLVIGEVIKAVNSIIENYTHGIGMICNNDYLVAPIANEINYLMELAEKCPCQDIIDLIDTTIKQPLLQDKYDDFEYEIRIIDNLIELVKILLINHADFISKSTVL